MIIFFLDINIIQCLLEVTGQLFVCFFNWRKPGSFLNWSNPSTSAAIVGMSFSSEMSSCAWCYWSSGSCIVPKCSNSCEAFRCFRKVTEQGELGGVIKVLKVPEKDNDVLKYLSQRLQKNMQFSVNPLGGDSEILLDEVKSHSQGNQSD